MKTKVLISLIVMMFCIGVAAAWTDRERRDRDECDCCAKVTQAYFITNGWGGYGEMELIDVPGTYPAFPHSMSLTSKVSKPQNGTAAIETYYFFGEFIDGHPVYELAG